MTCPELTTFHNGYWETPTHFHLGGHVEAKCNYKYVVPSSGERKTQDIWCEANGTWSQVQDCVKGSSQATDLDVWASRVKCPARFVSHLHEICLYIWVVYSICLFCCLFIIVTWWYVWCIVWANGRVGVNSIPELELQLNSNSNSGIGIWIEIGGIVNGIGIEDSGIGIENRNWIFCNFYRSIY